MDNHSMSISKLTCSKESSYFTILAIFSALVWLLVAVSIFGLIYVGMFALITWFANGLLIARLRAEAVEVPTEQMPELFELYCEACNKLGVATRHSGRDFVVLYSSMLDLCAGDEDKIRFLLGHELGHIRSKHIGRRMAVAPGLVLPLIGNAYRRACETTCDRFGAYACADMGNAAGAMMLLVGGQSASKMSAADFANQYFRERGFFVSLLELASAIRP